MEDIDWVMGVALDGINPMDDVISMASMGFVVDPDLYIEPPPSPPPPPPSGQPGYGGGYTGAGNIAARTGHWGKARPFWDLFDQQNVEIISRGAIRFRGKTSVVVIPKAGGVPDAIRDIPWDQVREEDDVLLGVMSNEHGAQLRQALESVDAQLIKEDDMLLLLGVAGENNDDDVVLML